MSYSWRSAGLQSVVSIGQECHLVSDVKLDVSQTDSLYGVSVITVDRGGIFYSIRLSEHNLLEVSIDALQVKLQLLQLYSTSVQIWCPKFEF